MPLARPSVTRRSSARPVAGFALTCRRRPALSRPPDSEPLQASAVPWRQLRKRARQKSPKITRVFLLPCYARSRIANIFAQTRSRSRFPFVRNVRLTTERRVRRYIFKKKTFLVVTIRARGRLEKGTRLGIQILHEIQKLNIANRTRSLVRNRL